MLFSNVNNFSLFIRLSCNNVSLPKQQVMKCKQTSWFVLLDNMLLIKKHKTFKAFHIVELLGLPLV